ncbi:Protein of unknown function [Anaerobranca californiensis DSM 14826]|jgi:hypothetical protein|uniref:DUF2922 domain-containing protein n=1 Tax=Anaerobranca californiensis DSM 14826 TaxID=1120989 RepID=A0A1M6Q2I5_9FIRM|nr:DUF2922 domain-containing protein [Anaerobranca californiensis]SHK14452.1 Protein of unknown function [Anaerobranca californiensis DSM 14826]
MNKTLQLVFKNQEGKTVTLSLNDPIEPIDSGQVQEVMDTIIARDVFTSTGGSLVEKVTARLVAREVTEIF